MNSTLETLSPTRVRLTVEVTPDTLRPAIDKAFKTIAGQVNIPGFRRGRVPSRIIEQRYGRAMVLEEALNDTIPGAYEAAVAEHGLDALGQPDVTIDQDLAELGPDEVVTFTAEVDVRPKLDLPEYRGLEVQVADAIVTEESIQATVDDLRARFATVTPVDRAAADGDLVVVDVEGTIDGERFEEFSGAGMTFEVGSGQMVDGFDDAVRGKSEGDSATFTFTADEGEFAGREAELTVTVRGVRERELPEADDDFAQLASEFDTIDELRDDMADRLARVKLVEQGVEARDKLTEQLSGMLEIPVPEGVLAAMVDQHFADGHGDDEHRDKFTEEARESLRQQFLFDAIADAEDVTVGQQDLGQWIVQQAPRYDMTPDQFIQALVQADQLASAYADVRRGKAMSVVLEHAVITDASGNPVDLAALDEAEEEAEIQAEEDTLLVEEDIDIVEDYVDEDGDIVEVVEHVHVETEVESPEAAAVRDVVDAERAERDG